MTKAGRDRGPPQASAVAAAPWAAALLAAALLGPVAVSQAVGAAPPVPTPPELGCLDRGALYGAHVREWDSARRRAQPGLPKRTEVWRARLTPAGLAGKRVYSWRLPAWEGNLVRWRIHAGHLWWTGEEPESPTFQRVPLIRLFGPEQAEGNFEPYSWRLDPLAELTYANMVSPTASATHDAHYDFVPAGRERMALLVAWRGELQVWRGALNPRPDGRNWVKWDGAIKTAAKDTAALWDFPPSWRARTAVREPFHAFQDRTHLYLVTVSGRLYACPQRGGPTELLWGDRARPIRALVSDAGTGRTFAFTGAGVKGGAVYFELAPRPKPVPYDVKGVAARKEGDPLASLGGYAAVLLKAKKVKPAE